MSAARLYAMFPLLRFSYERGAYVLRFVGETHGPVLRKDRRRGQQEFGGPDRREGAVDLFESSRPLGSVRLIEAAEPPRRGAKGSGAKGSTTGTRTPETARQRADATAASRRRRQHGRQRPPRPHH